MAIGALIGGGISAIAQYHNTGQVDWGKVGQAAVAGAVVAGGVLLGATAVAAITGIGAGAAATATAASTAASLACEDGDCTNEARGLATVEQNLVAGTACSFSADTKVVSDKGEVPIASIKVGDHVLSWNSKDGTISYHEVTATLTHFDEVLTELIIDGEWIETTPEHPFFTEEKGWLPASELRTSMHVRQASSNYKVVWLKWNIHKTKLMYNLTVETAHTFFVGSGQWLVHNTCGLNDGLTNDPYGNDLVERAIQYHRQLPYQSSVTIGVADVDGAEYVSINGNANPKALETLQNIVPKGNLLIGKGNPPDLHAEGALFNKFKYLEDLDIGISNSGGPCPSCQKLINSVSNLRVFYPAKFWK
jgi:pretoxin HINT domain-containing protein